MKQGEQLIVVYSCRSAQVTQKQQSCKANASSLPHEGGEEVKDLRYQLPGSQLEVSAEKGVETIQAASRKQ